MLDDYHKELMSLMIQEQEHKVRKAKAEADEAVVRLETSQAMQRWTLTQIANDRNPLGGALS